MAKNRNKKNKAKKSGGVAAMDTSEGGPATSTAADAPQRNSPLSFSFNFWGVFVFAYFSFYKMARFMIFFLCLAAMDTSKGKQPSSATAALGSINK